MEHKESQNQGPNFSIRSASTSQEMARTEHKEAPSSKKRRFESEEERRREELREHVSFSERLLRFALRVTPSRLLAGRLPQLREDILKSNLSITPESIVAISIFSTIVCVPVVAIAMFLMISAGLLLFALFLPIFLFIPFVVGLNAPKISASSRAQAIENELPYVVGYITVLAGGGISPFVAIKRLAKADSIFPAAAKEARRILLDIDLFGLDPISAFEKAARYNPNRRFGDFISGYVSVLKVGGDVLSYLNAQLNDIFAYRQVKMRTSTETIGTLAESYIIATVVVGISVFILFLTANILAIGGPTGDPSMIALFVGAFVPILSIVFIIVVNSAQIKEPFTYYPPYYVFLAFLPVGIAFYFLSAGIPQYLQVGIALVIISTPATILNVIYTRQKKAVEAKVPNFLRDISEVRKTGLAPEKTIEQISDRNYGGLSSHVKKISNQLGWGFPIRTVIESFSKEIKSWVTKAVAFLLLEVVDVGGGSPTMFVSLADFTEKNGVLEKERKAQVRPYVIIPYVGAVLVVITSALMVYLLSGPGLSVGSQTGTAGLIASPQAITQATNIMLIASIFQAWVMGIVAGKMGELTVADGFKHATLLVLISIAAIVIAKVFVKF